MARVASLAPAAAVATCAAPVLAQRPTPPENPNSLAALFRKWSELDQRSKELCARADALDASIPDEVKTCRVQIGRVYRGGDNFRPIYANCRADIEDAAEEAMRLPTFGGGGPGEVERALAKRRAGWDAKLAEMDGLIARYREYKRQIGLTDLDAELDRLSDEQAALEDQIEAAPIETMADAIALTRYAALLAAQGVDCTPKLTAKAADALLRLTT